MIRVLYGLGRYCRGLVLLMVLNGSKYLIDGDGCGVEVVQLP